MTHENRKILYFDFIGKFMAFLPLNGIIGKLYWFLDLLTQNYRKI